jgi:hypothetical protein
MTVAVSVLGTAPEGTTFVVELLCPDFPAHFPIPIHFDATGKATDANVFTDLGPGRTCDVTEIADGGATTVAYQCAYTTGPGGPGVMPGSCIGSRNQDVAFGDGVGDSATVTVVNTFAPVPTPVPTPPPPVVEIAPTFTG